MLIKLSTGKTCFNKQVLPKEITFSKLAAECSTPSIGTKDGLYFTRGFCSTNSRRNTNLARAYILPIDFDYGKCPTTANNKQVLTTPPSEVSEALNTLGLNHFIYTSYSNFIGDNKWRYRAVIELNRPMAPRELNPVLDQLYLHLPSSVARAAENESWSQPWYFPRVADQAAKKAFVFLQCLAGKPLDIDAVLSAAPTQPGSKKPLPPVAVNSTKSHTMYDSSKLDPQTLALAVNGYNVIGAFNQLYGTVEGFNALLTQHGYTRARASEQRWAKPNASHQAGVTLYNTERGGWLLSCHHANDVLTGDGLDYFEVFSRLEFADEPEAQRKNKAMFKARKLLNSQRVPPSPGTGVITTIPVLTPADAINELVWVETGDMVMHLSVDKRPIPIKTARSKYAASTYSESIAGKARELAVLDIWLQSPQRQSVKTVAFQPGKPQFCSNPDGEAAVNLWSPILRTGVINQAKIEVFRTHVTMLFAERSDDFLDWLAHIEQKPGVLPHTVWLHIATHTGVGRNFLASALSKVWQGYVAAGCDLQTMLTNGFNDDLSQKLLACVDEIREGKRDRWDNAERLKSMFNCSDRWINPKGSPGWREANYCRWLLLSNHLDALPLHDNDRRVETVICKAKPQSAEYYIALYRLLNDAEFINSLGLWLRQRDISAFNPGKAAMRSKDKEEVLLSLKTDEMRTCEDLIRDWPCDLISNAALAFELTSGSQTALKPNLAAIAKACGLVDQERMRVGNTTQRIRSLRNHDHWKTAPTEAKRDELLKANSSIINKL